MNKNPQPHSHILTRLGLLVLCLLAALSALHLLQDLPHRRTGVDADGPEFLFLAFSSFSTLFWYLVSPGEGVHLGRVLAALVGRLVEDSHQHLFKFTCNVSLLNP